MTMLSADEIRPALTESTNVGPLGFDMGYKVTGPVDVTAANTAVATQVDEQSRSQAMHRLTSGTNAAHVPLLDKATREEFGRVPAIEAHNKQASDVYMNMMDKRGVLKPVARASVPAISGARTLRSSLAQGPQKKSLPRIAADFLRRAKEISTPKQKINTISLDALPESAKQRMLEQALQKGEAVPQALIPSPLAQATSMVKGPKAVARTVADQMKRWGHALMDGSYVDLTPRLIRR